MLDNAMSIMAPHYCCGCDKIGGLFCDNCKYNIVSEQYMSCIVCQKPTAKSRVCGHCHPLYELAWCVGERSGVLQRLIGLYKFDRAIEAHKPLADLILDILPKLPSDTVIVPIPTTPGRTRERGYDHIHLITKRMSKARGLECKRLISRVSDTKQRDSSAKQRQSQASKAFVVNIKLNPTVPYLLVDDVMTTGATAKYAAKSLIDAGAKRVWLAVVARQTLD